MFSLVYLCFEKFQKKKTKSSLKKFKFVLMLLIFLYFQKN
jgi:hypothetical protein